MDSPDVHRDDAAFPGSRAVGVLSGTGRRRLESLGPHPQLYLFMVAEEVERERQRAARRLMTGDAEDDHLVSHVVLRATLERTRSGTAEVPNDEQIRR